MSDLNEQLRRLAESHRMDNHGLTASVLDKARAKISELEAAIKSVHVTLTAAPPENENPCEHALRQIFEAKVIIARATFN